MFSRCVGEVAKSLLRVAVRLLQHRKLGVGQEGGLLLVETRDFLCERAHDLIELRLQHVVSLLDGHGISLSLQNIFQQVLQVNLGQIVLYVHHDRDVGAQKGNSLVVVSYVQLVLDLLASLHGLDLALEDLSVVVD